MTVLEKLEKVCARIGRKFLRIASFSYYLRTGLGYEYPICCTLQFAWDVSDLRHQKRSFRNANGPAIKRGSILAGVRENGEKKLYVPCSFHKGRHPGWEPYHKGSRYQLRLFSEEVGRP